MRACIATTGKALKLGLLFCPRPLSLAMTGLLSSICFEFCDGEWSESLDGASVFAEGLSLFLKSDMFPPRRFVLPLFFCRRFFSVTRCTREFFECSCTIELVYRFLSNSTPPPSAAKHTLPFPQLAGVDKAFFEASRSESRTLRISLKLMPVSIGYVMMTLNFLEGSMTKTFRNVSFVLIVCEADASQLLVVGHVVSASWIGIKPSEALIDAFSSLKMGKDG
mmetsp:Transcript_1267/g.2405  ORF Transcript_1267/g.2405 Transcript_1267/m.2405 type:complete len:222 (+) Transcript_1267:363-1028(+)